MIVDEKIRSSAPEKSPDRHPQSENYVKIVLMVCITIFTCFLLGIVFYYKNQGDEQIFTWFKNIQIFGSGFLSGIGILSFKKVRNLLSHE